MFFPSFIDFLLFSTILTNFLFSSYPLGSSVIDKPICFNLSSLTDVSPLLSSRSGAAFSPDHCPSNQSALFTLFQLFWLVIFDKLFFFLHDLSYL